MNENVEKILEQIRPGLQADGGDVELVGVKDGIVSLRLT
jgi:Fe-S cluster biogenesis protein NfuA